MPTKTATKSTWQKKFDKKFDSALCCNGSCMGHEYKNLLAFISQVEADAHERGEHDNFAEHGDYETGYKDATERAAKVAEDSVKLDTNFDTKAVRIHKEIHATALFSVAQSIRALKDE